MENTPKSTKRPGRPPFDGEAMTRFQLVIDRGTIADAERVAGERGQSVSQVIRGWIEAGRLRPAK